MQSLEDRHALVTGGRQPCKSISHPVPVIDRMEGDGLVMRRPNPDDRRSFVVRLTKKGRAIFEKMAIDHGHWVRDGFAGLTAAELKSLQSSMIQLRKHLEQDG